MLTTLHSTRPGTPRTRVPGDGGDDAVDEVLGEALDGGAPAGVGVHAVDVAPHQPRDGAPRRRQIARGGGAVDGGAVGEQVAEGEQAVEHEQVQGRAGGRVQPCRAEQREGEAADPQGDEQHEE